MITNYSSRWQDYVSASAYSSFDLTYFVRYLAHKNVLNTNSLVIIFRSDFEFMKILNKQFNWLFHPWWFSGMFISIVT